VGSVRTVSLHWGAEGARMAVNVRPGEPFEELYRRFKRAIEASGILREYRRKQRFTPAHEVRRDKIRNAARKLRRAREKAARR
jgi:ribosomal protein S21